MTDYPIGITIISDTEVVFNLLVNGTNVQYTVNTQNLDLKINVPNTFDLTTENGFNGGIYVIPVDA